MRDLLQDLHESEGSYKTRRSCSPKHRGAVQRSVLTNLIATM